MDVRERVNPPQTDEGPGSGPGGANLDEIRQQMQRFRSTGTDAIRRALSADSQSFNTAARQDGGQ